MSRHKFRYPQPTKFDGKLIGAAEDGDYQACLEAIRDGGRVNAVSHRYQTPLAMATRSQSIEIVRMLLEAGAETDSIKDGKSPLMEAVYRGNRELIDILIEHGADVFAKLKLDHNVYMDVPQFALEAANKKLAIELRSLINQQRKIKDGTRLLLRDVVAQLNLDEKGNPKTL